MSTIITPAGAPDLSGYPSPYREQLAVALEAALAAGSLLHAAFLSPGGAAGHGAKSPVDTEAERLIRERLERAWPDYGMRGEELPALDRLPGADGRPVPPGAPRWLVDPNDGTDAYLSGRRGASVSIGLVVGDAPVLGVVFAYAARSGYGDLFCWAQGGPVLRNSRPVVPADRLRVAGAPLVLASGGADTASAANAAACAPARVRAEPSIAYRLALVAAGEADAAFSIYNPNDYDVAAGHALVTGSGGDLYAAGGAPVRYASSARADGSWSRTGDCFGGVGRLPVEFSARDWSPLKRTPHDRHPDYPFVKSERSLVCPDAGLLDRACGAMLGMIAGDSLGSLVEFEAPGEIARAYPGGGPRELEDGGTWGTLAGQPTDDSELGIILARAILRAGRYDPAEAARAYAFWHGSRPFDEGRTTRAAFQPAWRELSAGRENDAIAAASRAGALTASGSEANGALMRLAPLAIHLHARDDDSIAAAAMEDAGLSHASPVCLAANAAFAVALAALVRGESRTEAIARARAALPALEGGGTVSDAIAEGVSAGPPDDMTVNQGWVLLALRNAFARLAADEGVREGVIRTVAMGGDTDTNASIAGALLGAADGAEALPPGWRAAILSCRPLPGSCRRPRPEPFWPVDALRLAERLVVLGQGRPFAGK